MSSNPPTYGPSSPASGVARLVDGSITTSPSVILWSQPSRPWAEDAPVRAALLEQHDLVALVERADRASASWAGQQAHQPIADPAALHAVDGFSDVAVEGVSLWSPAAIYRVGSALRASTSDGRRQRGRWASTSNRRAAA